MIISASFAVDDLDNDDDAVLDDFKSFETPGKMDVMDDLFDEQEGTEDIRYRSNSILCFLSIPLLII